MINKGIIVPGKDGDLVILNKSDLSIKSVFSQMFNITFNRKQKDLVKSERIQSKITIKMHFYTFI